MSDFTYPNFAEDIEMLKIRLHTTSEQHLPLLKKWIERLEKTQREMRHLERIERFSIALKEKQQENDV